MRNKNKETISAQQGARGSAPASGNDRHSSIDDAKFDEVVARLRAAQQHIYEAASHIPPLTPEQIHDMVSNGRRSQFQLRRQADRYLLALCLSLLALAACILWRTAPSGITPLSVALVILSAAILFVALRAARSLWLMRQSLRHRAHPYRMARYADRLRRLSRRRHLWLDLVLRSSTDAAPFTINRRRELITLRIPSYAMAMLCVLLLMGASIWIVIDNHHYSNELLLAGNHYAPSAEILMQSFSSLDIEKTLFINQSTAVNLLQKASDAVPKVPKTPEPSVLGMHSVATEPPLAAQDSLTTSTNNNIEEPTSSVDIIQFIERPELLVTCNSDSCSAEKYCNIIYDFLMNS